MYVYVFSFSKENAWIRDEAFPVFQPSTATNNCQC